MAGLDDICRRRLLELEAQGLLRRPVTVDAREGATLTIDDTPLVSFASNDYLGLSTDPRLAQAAAEATARWGSGAGASRLVCGNLGAHVELERAIADFEGREDAVLFPSGYAANVGAIPALVGRGDAVVIDRLCHASIVDGCRLSGARLLVYKHCDPASLTNVLTRADSYRHVLVVTDTVFSMDGDLAPLPKLAAVCAEHNAVLMADEAHATGVFGATGRGVAEAQGACEGVDVLMGTLSKALGSQGGFVAGPRSLCDLLRNVARSFVYTTAPAPGAVGAAAEALRIVRTTPSAGEAVLAAAAQLRRRLSALGFDTLSSASQIIPIAVGEPGDALALSAHLRSHGLFVPAIRPPTVPSGTSRLRVSVTAAHTPEQLDKLASALEEWRRTT